jgi:uncharacterized membrane protein
MTSADTSSHLATGLAKHRVEALTDGIFAVAMTLLVIELKLPDHATVQSQQELLEAVAHLVPRFIAWIISFFVLAIFWFGHHRLFHHLRIVDRQLVWLDIGFLAFVSLMPFSSALVGEYTAAVFSQVFYSTNMFMLAVFALLKNRHVFHRPELWLDPVTPAFYRAARFRTSGLMVVALVAILIAYYLPGAGNIAFLLMIPIASIGRRMERAAAPKPPPDIPATISA